MADRSDSNFDLSMYNHVVAYEQQLKSLYGQRNEQADDMVNIYMMNWTDEEKTRKKGGEKITKSPDGRNRLQGAIRLMVAADPVFTVARDTNAPIIDDAADKLELAANVIWNRAGRVNGDPVHYDVVRSLLLFAEAAIAITRTADIVENTIGAPDVVRRNAERIAAKTPVLFNVWDARTYYPEYGPLGLRAFYREVDLTAGAIIDEFGDRARKALGLKDYTPYDSFTLCHFWDTEYRYVHTLGCEIPIVQEKHGLPEIPIVHTLGDGSRMFSKPEEQREPFLLAVDKSQLWERQNLMLTLFYTFAFALGANPAFVNMLNENGEGVIFDPSIPGGIAKVPYGGQFQPMLNKGIIDPALRELMQVATEMIGESTIYSQTLGEPLSGNAPFSMVALLHQAGRLPLIVPQRKGSWGLGDAVRVALQMMRYTGDDLPGIIDAAEIPEEFEIEAQLDVTLPQDDLQAAQTAGAVSSGERPLVSQRYAREHYLKIGDSAKMTEEIWDEQMSWLRMQEYYNIQMQNLLTQRQQLEQMMLQMSQPQEQQPGAGTVPPGMAAGSSGEYAPPFEGEEEQPQLVPPVMEQNGQQPPQAPPFYPGE